MEETKNKAEKVAYYINLYRVWPRIMITLYGFAFWRMTEWFMHLSDPTGAQAAFVSTIVGAGAAWFGLYVSSGNKS